MPVELRCNAVVQKCAHDAFQLIATHQAEPSGLPSDSTLFHAMEEADHLFTAQEREFGSSISFMNRLRLQNARLSLHCLAFISDSTDSPRKAWVLKAYRTACQVINLVLSEPTSHSLLPHAPIGTFRILWTAAAVIFRVVHSTYREDVDVDTSHIVFTTAAFALRQLSVPHKQKDIAIRSSDLLTLLWRCGQTDQSMILKPPHLRVKTRMASSLTFDTLLIARSFAARERETWLEWRRCHAPELGSDSEQQINGNGLDAQTNAPENDPGPAPAPAPAQFDDLGSAFDGLIHDNMFADGPFPEGEQGLPPAWHISPDLSWMANFGYDPLFATDDN
jgi:hypothetical protein